VAKKNETVLKEIFLRTSKIVRNTFGKNCNKSA
jgi:hypothetical protein